MVRSTTRMARTARVRPQSDRRQADAVVRRALVARLLSERPVCEGRVQCRGAMAVDVHERLTRARGGSITDPDQAHMVTLCRPCHTWVTEHPTASEALRLMLPSWHQCPVVGPC